MVPAAHLDDTHPGRGATGDGRRANFDFPPIDKPKADRIVETMRAIADAAPGTALYTQVTAWAALQPLQVGIEPVLGIAIAVVGERDRSHRPLDGIDRTGRRFFQRHHMARTGVRGL